MLLVKRTKLTFINISQLSRPTVVTLGNKGKLYVPSILHKNALKDDILCDFLFQ